MFPCTDVSVPDYERAGYKPRFPDVKATYSLSKLVQKSFHSRALLRQLSLGANASRIRASARRRARWDCGGARGPLTHTRLLPICRTDSHSAHATDERLLLNYDVQHE
jgi:hypothetical protein